METIQHELSDFECLTQCDSCTLNGTRKVHTFIVNPLAVDILVIGQSPGKNEVSVGRPFVGESGNLVNPILRQYSPNLAYINAISCRPYDVIREVDRVPTSVELKSCRGRFNNDFSYVIDTYSPKVVVVFGAIAKKAINLVLDDEKYKSVVVYNFDHPAYILRNDHLKTKFTSDIHNSMKSVFNKSELDDITCNFISYDDSLENQFLDDVNNSRNIGVDIETNKLDMFDPTFIIGTAAISCDKRTYFFDFRERPVESIPVFKQVLEDKRYQKIFADIMFDVVALTFDNYGIKVSNYSDVFPLAFIYDNTFNEYNLEAITMRYFPELASYKSRFKSTVVDNNYLDVNTDDLKTYNCFDSFTTKLIYNSLYDKLNGQVRLAFDRIHTMVLPALVSMKISGMKIDVELLDQYMEKFRLRFNELSDKLRTKHGLNNVNSPVQVSKWLFNDLKLKPVKYNQPSATQKDKGIRQGSASTDKEVIETYASTVPDVRLLYEARRIANLMNYTLKSIKDNVDFCGFIHPRYKHYGIQSYRLSCLAPNLQGISRDKTGLEFLDKYPIRRVFQSRGDNYYMVEFDYSQQEVRIIAELARDKGMLEAFSRKDDIHRFVASMLFKKEQKQISEFERQIAKSCVFGAIFGASAKETGIKLRISESDAQAYLNRFFSLFPGIKSYIERQHTVVLSNKVVVSMLGQPRKFVVHKNNINDCKREAANHTIQSVAAGITFIALRLAHEKLIADGRLFNDVFIIHTVHDSILFDVHKSQLKYVLDTVGPIMSSIPKKIGLSVDYPVDSKVGQRWGESLDINEVLNNKEEYNATTRKT